VDVLFIPYDVLEEEMKNEGRELTEYISAWLIVHGSNIYDFKDALENLAEYCGDIQGDYTGAGLLMTFYAFVMGYCSFWAAVPLVGAAIYCGRRASMYDNFEDSSYNLGYNLPTRKVWREILV